MTGLIAGAALVLSLGHTGWSSGYAVFYAPHVMEAVAHKRGIAEQPCLLAWTQASDADIGTTWLRVVGPGGSATCLAVDLPRPGKDKQNLIRRGVLVELGYMNRNLCLPGWSGRAIDCRVSVIPIR